MKDGGEAGGPVQVVVSSQELYEDYLNWYLLQSGSEVRPCGDPGLQVKAAQFLSREADLSHTFTLFPFQQAVREKCEDSSRDRRKHLTAFIKAAEMLETICVNLFLQPWRKEIKTLKTFTGAYVYCLLPVFSSSTLQSVLASIGYLPHDTAQSELRLRADADPKTAMQLGFELLLARVQCYHLLDRLEEDQLGPQEWLEALHRREQNKKLTHHTEKKTKLEEMKDNKEEKRDEKEVSVDPESSPPSKPQPKPRRYHLNSADQSVMEMQKEYSDLAFRGRPLVPEQHHRTHGDAGSKNIASNAVVSKRNSIKGSKAPTLLSEDGFTKADKTLWVSGKTSGSADEDTGRTPTPSDVSASDELRVDNELSGPQAISLYATERAELEAKPRPRTRKTPSTEEYPARTRQQTDGEIVRVAKQEFESLCSTDEEQELRQLSERMGHLCVREIKPGARTTKENPKVDDNAREELRQKERKSFERGVARQNLKTQEMETVEVVSHDPSRSIKYQPQWKIRGEQKHSSEPTESSADCKGLQEGKTSERGQKDRAEDKFITLC